MVKPLWALTGIALLGTAGVAGALVVASSGGEEEVVQQVAMPSVTPVATAGASSTVSPTPSPPPAPSPTPNRTAGPGETLYRWANLTVVTAPEQGVIVSPNFAGATRDQQLALVIGKVEPSDSRIFSQVLVHQSGRILEETVLDQHRADIEAVLLTLSVSSFNRATAPWLYNGEPDSNLQKETAGDLTYIEPSPASGLYVGGGLGDPGGPFVTLQNERSRAFIHLRAEGPVYDTSNVIEEDKPIFDRWFAAIKQCDPETEC